MRLHNAAAVAVQFLMVFVVVDGLVTALVWWLAGSGIWDVCWAFVFAVPALFHSPIGHGHDVFARDAEAIYGALTLAPAELAALLSFPITLLMRKLTRTPSIIV